VDGLAAAVDLGSNSFHLIVARVDQNELVAVERLKEKVQLSRGAATGELSGAAIARGLECIARLAQRLRSVDPARVVVVGTAALRDARNRDEFLKPAAALLAHPIRVLTGDEEAELIFLGVSHALSVSDAQRLVIDIGGGSTEFCVGRSFAPSASTSIALGCVTLTDRWFDQETSFAHRYAAARRDAAGLIAPIAARWRAEARGSVAIGTSGTIEAVQSVLIANGFSTGPITRAAVVELERAILERRWISDVGVPGLAPERVDIFPAGLAALAAVLDALDIDRVEFVEASLQDGLLYDLVARRAVENVQARTVVGWQRRFNVDREQSQRVRRTALALLRSVAASWELGDPNCSSLLGWAADLHEIGLVVSARQPNRHGAYLVENGELPGFNADERRAVALLIRSHRGGFPMFALASLSDSYSQRIKRLAILLRLAVILERTRTDAESPQVSVSAGGDRIDLILTERWLAEHALSRRELEWEHERLAAAGIRLEQVLR
jgi:exopolyphosphatase / guanosine-5'-triphosphate,3'-diphosphate pyrophosphatase